MQFHSNWFFLDDTGARFDEQVMMWRHVASRVDPAEQLTDEWFSRVMLQKVDQLHPQESADTLASNTPISSWGLFLYPLKIP